MKNSDIIQSIARDEDGRLHLDSLKNGIDYKIQLEDKGKRKKIWLKFTDKRFLVKSVKEGTYEDYAELLAEEICNQLELPSAHYDLAILNGEPCVITEDFVKFPREKLESGKTFMASSVKILKDNGLYKRKALGNQKELNNLEMIEKCLSIYLPEDRLREEMKHFDMLFALNCFCLNGDIHLSNWSVIRDYKGGSIYRLAPNYDSGSYFRFNISKINLFKHIRNLLRQKKSENISKILEEDIFGKDYEKHNSLNFRYTSTDELGLSRFEEAYKEQPERFAEIAQKLYELNPYEAIENVRKKLGGVPIPEECATWFISVIEKNQERLSQIVDNAYVSKEGVDYHGI